MWSRDIILEHRLILHPSCPLSLSSFLIVFLNIHWRMLIFHLVGTGIDPGNTGMKTIQPNQWWGGANVGSQLHVKQFILLLLFINHWMTFHANECKPTFATSCIFLSLQLFRVLRLIMTCKQSHRRSYNTSWNRYGQSGAEPRWVIFFSVGEIESGSRNLSQAHSASTLKGHDSDTAESEGWSPKAERIPSEPLHP